MGEKACAACESTKSHAEFSFYKRASDRLQSYCKGCASSKAAAYYLETQEVRKARAAANRAANPERTKASTAAWRSANAVKFAEAKRDYRKRNAEHVKAQRRASYLKNKERDNAASRAWKAAHKAELAQQQRERIRTDPVPNRVARSLRRAREKQAVPPWADRAQIEERFELAAALSAETGIKHHVDHIVPLRSPIVCGLHWHENMQVIPAAQNQSKLNRYWPDMPL